jgi:hypothetical protein
MVKVWQTHLYCFVVGWCCGIKKKGSVLSANHNFEDGPDVKFLVFLRLRWSSFFFVFVSVSANVRSWNLGGQRRDGLCKPKRLVFIASKHFSETFLKLCNEYTKQEYYWSFEATTLTARHYSSKCLIKSCLWIRGMLLFPWLHRVPVKGWKNYQYCRWVSEEVHPLELRGFH